jgi:hypothetical protein
MSLIPGGAAKAGGDSAWCLAASTTRRDPRFAHPIDTDSRFSLCEVSGTDIWFLR